MGTLVPKEGEHTLLVIPPWSLAQVATVHRWLPRVISLGHVPCATWSTGHSLTLETTSMGVQGTTWQGQDSKSSGCVGGWKTDPDWEGVSTLTETGALPGSCTCPGYTN